MATLAFHLPQSKFVLLLMGDCGMTSVGAGRLNVLTLWHCWSCPCRHLQPDGLGSHLLRQPRRRPRQPGAECATPCSSQGQRDQQHQRPVRALHQGRPPRPYQRFHAGQRPPPRAPPAARPRWFGHGAGIHCSRQLHLQAGQVRGRRLHHRRKGWPAVQRHIDSTPARRLRQLPRARWLPVGSRSPQRRDRQPPGATCCWRTTATQRVGQPGATGGRQAGADESQQHWLWHTDHYCT